MKNIILVLIFAFNLRNSLEFNDEPDVHRIHLIDKRPPAIYVKNYKRKIKPEQAKHYNDPPAQPVLLPQPKSLPIAVYREITTAAPQVFKTSTRSVNPVAYSFLTTNRQTLVVPHVNANIVNKTDTETITSIDVQPQNRKTRRRKSRTQIIATNDHVQNYPVQSVLPGNNLQNFDQVLHTNHVAQSSNHPTTTEIVRIRERRKRPTEVIYEEYRTPSEVKEPVLEPVLEPVVKTVTEQETVEEPYAPLPQSNLDGDQNLTDQAEYEATYAAPVAYTRSRNHFGRKKSKGKDEDQKLAASGSHSDKSHGEENSSSSEESGGGSSYDTNRYQKKGNKGAKGTKGYKKFEKGGKGHKDKESNEGEYGEEKGHLDKGSEGGGHYGEHHKEEAGQKDTKYGKGGKHKKGKTTKGEHNIVKKNEFTKSTVFYDEDHEDGEHEKHAEHQGKHREKKGGHEKGEYKKAHFDESNEGKKGHFDKGHHDEENYGHESEEGEDEFFDEEEHYGSKKGDEGGKKWSYAKGEKGR